MPYICVEMIMKCSTFVLSIITLLSLSNLCFADWRKEASDEEKLKNLVGLVPGTAHWMAEMGDRYQNLYWAAKQEKWEFAIYQSEEIEKLIKVVQIARPKRAASAQQFIDAVFPMLNEAIDRKAWADFQPAFAKLNAECMACHVKEDHGFITIPLEPATASSTVLDMK